MRVSAGAQRGGERTRAARGWMRLTEMRPRARRACRWTDSWHHNGGDDEGGEAGDEDAPSRAAAPGAGRSRAPERYRRDGATPRR